VLGLHLVFQAMISQDALCDIRLAATLCQKNFQNEKPRLTHLLFTGQIESNYDEVTDSFDAMNLKPELLRGKSIRKNSSSGEWTGG
jgi:hypothetical protein